MVEQLVRRAAACDHRRVDLRHDRRFRVERVERKELPAQATARAHAAPFELRASCARAERVLHEMHHHVRPELAREHRNRERPRAKTFQARGRPRRRQRHEALDDRRGEARMAACDGEHLLHAPRRHKASLIGQCVAARCSSGARASGMAARVWRERRREHGAAERHEDREVVVDGAWQLLTCSTRRVSE